MLLDGQVISHGDLRQLIDSGLANLIARWLIANGVIPEKVCRKQQTERLRERQKVGE
jgi:hypothetical protein